MNEKTVKDTADETIITLLKFCKEEADPRLIEAVASLIEATNGTGEEEMRYYVSSEDDSSEVNF